jgi:hypothetical protein
VDLDLGLQLGYLKAVPAAGLLDAVEVPLVIPLDYASTLPFDTTSKIANLPLNFSTRRISR